MSEKKKGETGKDKEKGKSLQLFLFLFVPFTVYHNRTPLSSFSGTISSRARKVILPSKFVRTDGEIS